MAHKKIFDQASYSMSRIKNENITIELLFEEELKRRGITTFTKENREIPGNPDFAFTARKIAVFCGSDVCHECKQDETKEVLHNNQDFWIPKIEQTRECDLHVNMTLQEQGWKVFRFWSYEIKKQLCVCVDKVENALRTPLEHPYKTIDLCAGIGGIRKGFELTGKFKNVLSAEIDKYACRTYRYLFGDNPENDLTSDAFKKKVENTQYDVLLAGFPCQTFSRVGNEEGFDDETKGKVFFHIAEIIHRTRPMAFFLENVDHLVTHDNGKTFRIIVDTLVNKLGYYVMSVGKASDGTLEYNPKSFVRNSKDFGVPQNRPRTYIIGFDTERFSVSKLEELTPNLPVRTERKLYTDLNALLDKDVDAKYYMASGYLETLIKHRARQEGKGYGFGYRIVNEPSIAHPVANSLLATGGSGKERNLIYDPKDGIAGLEIQGKKTPLNDKGIRIMTPLEWGKLQGFINYAFIDETGKDLFSFPEGISDAQRYKQFGNSVTIPVIEAMANYILECLDHLATQ